MVGGYDKRPEVGGRGVTQIAIVLMVVVLGRWLLMSMA